MEFFFHVNPPEQRGRNRDKKSRATFCGIVNGDTLKMGVSFCHTVDMFSRKMGRIKAKGNALSQKSQTFDITHIAEENRNDFFVTMCRRFCDTPGVNLNHNYTRRKKNKVKQIAEL